MKLWLFTSTDPASDVAQMLVAAPTRQIAADKLMVDMNIYVELDPVLRRRTSKRVIVSSAGEDIRLKEPAILEITKRGGKKFLVVGQFLTAFVPTAEPQ